MRRRSWISPGVVSGLLVPLAFFVSIATLSAHHVDRANSLETAFLGLLGTVALVALAFIEGPPHRVLAGTALAAAFALWAIPAGGARGATLSLLLAAGTVGALWRSLSAGAEFSRSNVFVALAISSQALFRPELWLAPGWRLDFVLSAILLPAVVGLCGVALGRSRDNNVLVALPLVVAIQRGINPELAFILVGYCAASAAFARRRKALGWLVLAGALLFWMVPQIGMLTPVGATESSVIARLAWIPVLAPALLELRGRRAIAAAAAVALAVGLTFVPAAGTIAVVVPLLVIFDQLALGTVAGRLQRTWSVILVAVSLLTSGYPWLRPQPVEAALALFGLGTDWRSAGIVILTFWCLASMSGWLEERAEWQPRGGKIDRVAVAVLGCALLFRFIPASRSLLSDPVVLSAARSGVELAVNGSVDSIFVDSYISNGVSVEPGTPLVELTVQRPTGARETLVLRAGTDTGEWAARRPGLRTQAPVAWISWPAPDGPYLAQRYRTLRRFDPPIEAERISLQRFDQLPNELEVAVFQVGVTP